MSDPRKQFSRIYDKYIEKIYKFVFLKVNCQQTAEDITSEAFSRTWAVYRESQNDIRNVRAFLYKTASNLVVDYYREKGKVNTVPIHENPVVDQSQDIENKALMSSDMETIRKGLSNLKEDYQNVIIWHYLDDLPISEVSELLNKKESATRVMLHRALKALKKHVREV